MLKAITAQFVIHIDDTRLSISKGKIPSYFRLELYAILPNFPEAKGKIYGMKRNQQVLLEFSSSLPSALTQRLRNVWRYTPATPRSGRRA